MKWFEAPYRMLAVAVLTWLLLLITGWWWLLLLALPTSFYVGYLTTLQPEIIIAPRATMENLKGVRYTERNNLDEAMKCYDRAIDYRSSFVQARVNRGLLHMERRDYDAAYTDFDVALVHNKAQADAYAGRGQVRLLRGEEHEAQYDWLQAEQYGSRLVYTLRGAYYLDTGKYRDALLNFEEAVRLQPDNAIALYNAAFLTALIGNPDEARQLADRAIRREAAISMFYVTRGIAYYRLNDLSAALSDFLKAGEFKRDLPLAIAGQMLVYADMDKTNEVERLKAYLASQNPDFVTAAFYADEYNLTGEFLDALAHVLRG